MSTESDFVPLIEHSIESSNIISSNNEMSQVICEQLLGNKYWSISNGPSIKNVSFELIESEDDTQELIDISDELQASDAAQNLLTQFDDQLETNVSETPPPQGKPSQHVADNATDYLFKNSVLYNNPKNKISKLHNTTSSKRNSSVLANKRPLKIKKVEGYSCKLNGKMYQIVSRDLEILEAIEEGLQGIQKKIQQHKGQYNVRLLGLQLNQIETVMSVLEDDRLDLCMSREAWDEMILCTKAMFRDTQTAVELFKNRILNITSYTDDDLSTSFSQNLNISCRKQTTDEPDQQSTPLNRIGNKKPARMSIKDLSPDVHQHENEIQILDSCQVSDSIISESIDHNRDADSVNGAVKGNLQHKKGRKKTISKVKSARGKRTNSSSRCSYPLTTRNLQQSEELSLPLLEDDSLFPLDSSLCCSQEMFTSTQLASQSNDTMDILLISSPNSVLAESIPKKDMPAPIINGNLSSQMVEKYRFTNSTRDISDHEDPHVIYDARDSQQSLSSQSIGKNCEASDKLKRLSKIVLMNFNLRPFVTKGVLLPGKNILKMNFNNRVYIASLAADGTIEMNGFTFQNVGNWIKSVEGKRFGEFARGIQRTLELLYNGKPIEDVLELEEQWGKSKAESNGMSNGVLTAQHAIPNSPSTANIDKDVPKTVITKEANSKDTDDLMLIPDEMTRHIQTIFLHDSEEYFPICQCVEQFWNGAQPFPRHLLDEVDSW